MVHGHNTGHIAHFHTNKCHSAPTGEGNWCYTPSPKWRTQRRWLCHTGVQRTRVVSANFVKVAHKVAAASASFVAFCVYWLAIWSTAFVCSLRVARWKVIWRRSLTFANELFSSYLASNFVAGPRVAQFSIWVMARVAISCDDGGAVLDEGGDRFCCVCRSALHLIYQEPFKHTFSHDENYQILYWWNSLQITLIWLLTSPKITLMKKVIISGREISTATLWNPHHCGDW